MNPHPQWGLYQATLTLGEGGKGMWLSPNVTQMKLLRAEWDPVLCRIPSFWIMQQKGFDCKGHGFAFLPGYGEGEWNANRIPDGIISSKIPFRVGAYHLAIGSQTVVGVSSVFKER